MAGGKECSWQSSLCRWRPLNVLKLQMTCGKDRVSEPQFPYQRGGWGKAEGLGHSDMKTDSSMSYILVSHQISTCQGGSHEEIWVSLCCECPAPKDSQPLGTSAVLGLAGRAVGGSLGSVQQPHRNDSLFGNREVGIPGPWTLGLGPPAGAFSLPASRPRLGPQ